MGRVVGWLGLARVGGEAPGPTDEQVQLALDLGCGREEAERMRERGMSAHQSDQVYHAQWLLDRLGESYPSLSFRARRLFGPAWGRSGYELTAAVAGGERDGLRLQARYDGEDPSTYEDSLWAKLHSQEWLDAARAAVGPVWAGQPADAYYIAYNSGAAIENKDGSGLDLTLGEADGFQENKGAFRGRIRITVVGDAVTEGDYAALADETVSSLEASGLCCRLIIGDYAALPEGVESLGEGTHWNLFVPADERWTFDCLVSADGTHTTYLDWREGS